MGPENLIERIRARTQAEGQEPIQLPQEVKDAVDQFLESVGHPPLAECEILPLDLLAAPVDWSGTSASPTIRTVSVETTITTVTPPGPRIATVQPPIRTIRTVR